MEDDILPAAETGFDQVLAFSVPARDARGRMVRLGPVLETVLSAHAYPQVAKHVLAEALVLTALMGSLLKDIEGQLTFQIQSQGGAIDLLVCDFRGGEVRGYLRHDVEKLDALGTEPSLADLFGTGFLAITFDLATSGERYQGIVPLDGESLAQVCESYFFQSEQVPTLIRVAVRSNGERCCGAGLLVQHLPDGEEGRERLHVKEGHPDWEHVAILSGSVKPEELVDPILPLEDLAWRLFHEETEIRVEPLGLLHRGCRCTVEHYQTILSRFPEDQINEMRDEEGLVSVDCAFCSKILHIPI